MRRVLGISTWDNTFVNFKPVRGAEKALYLFKQLASGKATWHMLLVYGTTGCGKTHLCEALSIEWYRQGIIGNVLTWDSLIRYLKKLMFGDIKDAYDTTFDRLCETPYLILDDVGMGSTNTEYTWKEFDALINHRYKYGLVTVVTTNLNINQLSDRAVSRLRDAVKSRIVLNQAPDYRPRRGK
jgi:DNA replication protein DnaC